MDFAVWENGRKPTDRGTIVASIQTLQLQRNAVHTILSPDTPLILGDEADLYLTLQRMGFLAYFPDAIRLGFSATGEWEDKRKINDIW
jgi:superfamily II DNA or RNA helicase